MNRRGFITGLFSAAVAAPAIIRVIDLMPVKAVPRWKTYYGTVIQSDVEDYFAEEILPMVRSTLVSYQFGDPIASGLIYRATRLDRVHLPDLS